MKQEFKELRKLLERDWTQGAFARNGAGASISADNPQAVSWCIEGAMTKVALEGKRHSPTDLHEVLVARLKADGVTKGVAVWNDARHRTHAEVLGFIDRVIESVD